MTGMKEGAGEDPFADEETESSQQSTTQNVESDPDIDGESVEDSTMSQDTPVDIPYKYRRDSVQEDRDRVPLFLHPETKNAEREAMRELEDKFGESVSMTDLREALVKAGLENLDETVQALQEWGYGLTFD